MSATATRHLTTIYPQNYPRGSGKSLLWLEQLRADLRNNPDATIVLYDHESTPEQMDSMIAYFRSLQDEGRRQQS